MPGPSDSLRSGLAGTRHPLLDQRARQIGVDQTALGACHRLAQGGIGDVLLRCEFRKLSCRVYLHQEVAFYF